VIRFLHASKTVKFAGKNSVLLSHALSVVVLRDATTALDVRTVAEIAHELPYAKTTFMKLITGSLAPDKGSVITKGVRVSPVINEGGEAAPLLMGILSVRENIEFQARLGHVKPGTMTDFVVSVADCGTLLDAQVRRLQPAMRRVIEAVMLLTVPFDLYLVDHAQALPEVVQETVVEVVKQRGAGLLFASARPQVGQRFAEAKILLRDGSLSCEVAR
jgi:ABC-type polysaccharide/polyol phosphate transport system ATPase subunit